MDEKLMQRINEVLADTQYHVYEINWTKMDNNNVLQVVVGDDHFTIDLDGCTHSIALDFRFIGQ